MREIVVDSLFDRIAMVRLLGRCLPIICMSRKKRQSLPICEQQSAGTKQHQEEINKLFVRRVESIRVTQQGAVFKRLPLQTINERHQQHKKTKLKSGANNVEKTVKPDDTEFDCETHISDRQSKQKNRIKSKKKSPSIKQKSIENNSSHSRTPLEKISNKTKKSKTPSPTPSCAIDIPEEDHDDITSTMSSSSSSSSSTSSMSSEWSTTTYPDSHSEKSNDLIDRNQRRQSMPVSNTTNSNHEIKHRSCVESFYLGREHVRQSSSPTRPKTASLSKSKEDSNKTKISQQKQKQQQQQQQQQQQNKRIEIKPSAKSKQVLQNVRKMIKDQNIQEQHFNDTRQRESVRL